MADIGGIAKHLNIGTIFNTEQLRTKVTII